MIWLPMQALNVWRIPILFFVSGMGVYFAMQQRTWKQLLAERTRRILIPYLFGMVVIFPVSSLMWQKYSDWQLSYKANPGHLWFLGNIFVYVVILSPLFYYLKERQEGKFVRGLRKLLSTPLGLIPVVGLFVAEVLIVKPFPYEMYATTWHGFILGFIAFFTGFVFVLSGESFWKMILRWRALFIAGAIGLFLVRIFVLEMKNPGYLLVVESQCWILMVFALGHRYLNYRSKALTYLSQAAYPVYIFHMIFLFLGSFLIFPLTISVEAKFIIVLLITFSGCFGAFEIIRRIRVLRPLFGLKYNESPSYAMQNGQRLVHIK